MNGFVRRHSNVPYSAGIMSKWKLEPRMLCNKEEVAIVPMEFASDRKSLICQLIAKLYSTAHPVVDTLGRLGA